MSRSLRAALLVMAGAFTIAAAPSPEARLDRMLAGRVAGKPVDCIALRDIRSSQIVDRTAIVYEVGSKLYVNRPRGGASTLSNDDILVTNTVGSQLCRVDVVRLIDRTSRMYSGFVNLGDFVPYTKPAR